jgi:hypothetical protein
MLLIQLDSMEIRSLLERLLMETRKAPHVQALFDYGLPFKIHIHLVS